MPWTETDVVDQRTEFVLRAFGNQERFGELCQQFGVSRKTGYKWKERFVQQGLSGLADHSRRPRTAPSEVAEAICCQIVKLRLAHPRWGARKLRAVLERTLPKEDLPSESSFKRILDKAGLVERRRRVPAEQATRLRTPARAERPNHVWTIDFKGWWYTRDRGRFEPLTIRDDFSRYVLCARALGDARTESVRGQMIRVFERHGLPEVIRSDNGSPFAARNSPLGLSRLSAWWLSLGISLDRIPPGRPDQNGGHERMHRDIAWEVEKSAAPDAPTQQAALDVWRRTFNEERPHEALGMRVPHEVYQESPRKFDPTPVELVYPPGYLVRQVGGTGSVKLHNRRINVSLALRGLTIGLQEVQTNNYAAWFCRLCLGQIDLGTQKFQAAGPCEGEEDADIKEETRGLREKNPPGIPGGRRSQSTQT
jgi:transposase InsO family protein